MKVTATCEINELLETFQSQCLTTTQIPGAGSRFQVELMTAGPVTNIRIVSRGWNDFLMMNKQFKCRLLKVQTNFWGFRSLKSPCSEVTATHRQPFIRRSTVNQSDFMSLIKTTEEIRFLPKVQMWFLLSDL